MKGWDNMGEMLEGDGVAGTQASDKDAKPTSTRAPGDAQMNY